MPGSTIVQKIEKKCVNNFDKAIKYYTVLFSLNDIYPSSKQIELLAFIAIRGDICPLDLRAEFIELFDSSAASLENIKCKLVKKGWLVKVDKKIKINDVLDMDFSNNLIVQIKLWGENDRINSEPADSIGQVENRVS